MKIKHLEIHRANNYFCWRLIFKKVLNLSRPYSVLRRNLILWNRKSHIRVIFPLPTPHKKIESLKDKKLQYENMWIRWLRILMCWTVWSVVDRWSWRSPRRPGPWRLWGSVSLWRPYSSPSPSSVTSGNQLLVVTNALITCFYVSLTILYQNLFSAVTNRYKNFVVDG